MAENNSTQKNNGNVSKIVTAIIAVAVIAAFALSIIMIVKAQSLGEDAAGFMADKLGVAVGNLEAAAECMVEVPSEIEKAKEEGLSAKDTTVEIMRTILEKSDGEQKLEVLSAGLGIKDFHKVSDTYSALYIIKATAIFTVDMSKAAITAENDKISIVLPEPECSMKIDEDSTKKLAERSRKIFDGETIDGYTAHINSKKEIASDTEKVLNDYPYLRQNAKDAARKAVGRLVRSVCGSEYDYEIRFESDREEDTNG